MALVLETIKRDGEVNIVETLIKLQEVKAQLKALKAQEKNLVDRLQKKMGDEEMLVDGDGDVLCTWKWSMRTTLNTDQLTIDHPDLVAKYTEMKKIRTFRC